MCGVWSEEHATDLLRAYIVPSAKLDNDMQQAAQAISDFLSLQVAGYKKLRGGIVFVNSLPKSPTGKLLRRLLTEETLKHDRVDVLARL